MNHFFVYFMTNRWKNVLYVGVTNNLERRYYEHSRKLVPGFTKKYNVDRLVYWEPFQDIRLAIAREKEIKGWSRAKKVQLIEGENREWKDLGREWFRDDRKSSPLEGDPSLRSG